MIINDLDGYYIVFDTKNWNTELDTLIIYIKICFLAQIEKTPQRVLKLFFKLMVNLLPFYFFVSFFFSTFANVILNTIFLP